MTRSGTRLKEQNSPDHKGRPKHYPNESEGVWARKGEPTAAEKRMLRWQLTPAEKKVVDFVMSHQADHLRQMTPEQSAKQAEKIRALLDDEPKKSD